MDAAPPPGWYGDPQDRAAQSWWGGVDGAPPPGWYGDPQDPSAERWWDGSAWSPSTRPVPPSSPAPPAEPGGPAAGSGPGGPGGPPEGRAPAPAAPPAWQQPPQDEGTYRLPPGGPAGGPGGPEAPTPPGPGSPLPPPPGHGSPPPGQAWPPPGQAWPPPWQGWQPPGQGQQPPGQGQQPPPGQGWLPPPPGPGPSAGQPPPRGHSAKPYVIGGIAGGVALVLVVVAVAALAGKGKPQSQARQATRGAPSSLASVSANAPTPTGTQMKAELPTAAGLPPAWDVQKDSQNDSGPSLDTSGGYPALLGIKCPDLTNTDAYQLSSDYSASHAEETITDDHANDIAIVLNGYQPGDAAKQFTDVRTVIARCPTFTTHDAATNAPVPMSASMTSVPVMGDASLDIKIIPGKPGYFSTEILLVQVKNEILGLSSSAEPGNQAAGLHSLAVQLVPKMMG